MEAVIEAILFVTSEPVPAEKILEVFLQRDHEQAVRALESVLDRYRAPEDARERGVMLDEAAGGLRLVTPPQLHPYLKRFFELTGSNRLSMAALETLAIVAYRQPITGPEIHQLRGKNSVGVLRTLLERRLVRIAGRKDVVGKPFLYATTRDFLLHFGLHKISDLPPLEEFEESFFAESDFPSTGLPAGEDREESVLRQLVLVEEGEDRSEESRADERHSLRARKADAECAAEEE